MPNSIMTYELSEFNLKPDCHLKLGGICGMIKILRSKDGRLILMVDSEYGVIDQTKPTDGTIVHADDLLAFVLDIGIRREKWLTYSNGLYLGEKLFAGQSHKEIKSEDYDLDLMNGIKIHLDKLFHSNEERTVSEAIRLSHLFKAYNDARLLYPDFISDSYLSLMRILDALPNKKGQKSVGFALNVSKISPSLNQEIYQKIMAIEGLRDRDKIALNVCEHVLTTSEGKKYTGELNSLNSSDKFVFASFYSAYQYRNKFVHSGFPFPSKIKEALYLEQESGLAYLHPSLGESLIKIFRPDGLIEGDVIDRHCMIKYAVDTTNSEEEAARFVDWYTLLIPTWHFVKRMVRAGFIALIQPH